MAHYLQSARRSYKVLEAAPTAASFFSNYPRWQKLISLNKRHTGRAELDFNLRHDWNSLLHDPSPTHHSAAPSSSTVNLTDIKPGLLFGDYDKKLWPNSKNLAKYMQHYAHTQGLNIAYNTPVVSVSKQGEEFVTKTQNGD